MKHVLKRVLTAGIGVGALVSASLVAGPLAAATTVTATEFGDPGFESPAISTAAPYYSNFPTSSSIGPWTVTAGDVDLVVAPYAVHGGLQALDLNGSNPGTIAQTFTVHPGLAYSVTYWVNANGSGSNWTIDVSSNGVSLASGPGHYSGGGAWQQFGPSGMVPTGSTMTVTLASQDSGSDGVILDDFTVTYVDPGPALSGVAVAANGRTVHLTGTASNGALGQGIVTGAQYQLSRGTWTGPWVGMSATDGSFSSATEAITADIPLPPVVGSYNVTVRATDGLGYTSDAPAVLTNAFTVNAVASGPIVANDAKTINSATDKGSPDYVIDAVAGMVGTVPVGHVDINYTHVGLRPQHFVPNGTAPYGFYHYGTGLSVDLNAWVSEDVTASSLQFMGAGALPAFPRGGFYMSTGDTAYLMPVSVQPSWDLGVPFDRGFVTVWTAS